MLWISAFASLVGVPVDIKSSAVELKMNTITAIIKKYKSIIKKKRKKLDKIVLLGKTKLNIIKILISKVVTDSYIVHDDFFLVNNVFWEDNEMKR